MVASWSRTLSLLVPAGPRGHGKGDMDIRELRRIKRRLILAAGVIVPGMAMAETGLFAAPSVAVAEVYDDNLFFSSSAPQRDFILRISPAIDAGYRSAHTEVHGRYALDAESYARHRELDSNRAREHAMMDVRHDATRLLTLSANAAYIKTRIPGELSTGTGLEFDRARAERITFGPALAYRLDRLTTGTASYGFTRDSLAGGIGSDAHVAALDLGRRVSRRDTASVGYRFGQFRFETGDSISSHTVLVGGTRDLTPQTAVSGMVGPRFSEGSAKPEGSISLLHKLDRGEFGLAYTHTETTVLGMTGTATAANLGATLAYRFSPSFEMRLAPGFSSIKHDDRRARVFHVNIEAGYRMAHYLTLIGSYQFSAQRGALTASAGGEIDRHVALLGIVVAAPKPAGPGSRPRVLTPSTLAGARPARRTATPPGELPMEEGE